MRIASAGGINRNATCRGAASFKSASLQRLLTHCWRVSRYRCVQPNRQYRWPVYTLQFTALVDGKPHDSDPLRGLWSRFQLFSDAVQSGGILVRI